jgi:hypothetical protein
MSEIINRLRALHQENPSLRQFEVTREEKLDLWLALFQSSPHRSDLPLLEPEKLETWSFVFHGLPVVIRRENRGEV